MEDRLLNLNDPVQSLEFLKMSTSHCTQVFSDYPLNTGRLAKKKRDVYEKTARQPFTVAIIDPVLELLTTFCCYLAVTASREINSTYQEKQTIVAFMTLYQTSFILSSTDWHADLFHKQKVVFSF